MQRLFLLAVLVSICNVAVRAGYAPPNPTWNQPVAPFTIAGNLHYVGATGVSAFLITTPDGHILIDSGFRETVPLIEAGVEKLGHRMGDIRILLVNHAHYDHAGGIADLKERTGARLLAHPAEFALLQAGGAGDFAFGDDLLFPPVTPDAPLHDGQEIELGGTVVTAHFTPGHTRGSTSWSLAVREEGRPLRVVIASSLTAPGYQLVDNASYPEIVSDFERSFATLRDMPCDIMLSSHGWDFDLVAKVAGRAAPGATNPFVDPNALIRLIDKAEQNLRAQIAEQRAKASPRASAAIRKDSVQPRSNTLENKLSGPAQRRSTSKTNS